MHGLPNRKCCRSRWLSELLGLRFGHVCGADGFHGLRQVRPGDVFSDGQRILCQLRGGNLRGGFRRDELHTLPSGHVLFCGLERMCELRSGHLQGHHGRHPMRELRRGQVCVNNGCYGLHGVRGVDVLGGRRERVLSLCT